MNFGDDIDCSSRCFKGIRIACLCNYLEIKIFSIIGTLVVIERFSPGCRQAALCGCGGDECIAASEGPRQ
jgi:hypothetical protein